jgi:beta-mannosidase
MSTAAEPPPGWEMVGLSPGTVSSPAELAGVDGWLPARVPGTAADAIRAARGVDAARDLDVDAYDWWYRTTLPASDHDSELVFNGLATIADVWLDGEHRLHSENMFRAYVVELPAADTGRQLVIRFAAMAAMFAARRQPRPRWRAGIVAHQNLRWYRTALLGRLPSFAGDAPAAGPWRSIEVRPLGPRVRTYRVRLAGEQVELVAEVEGTVSAARVTLAGADVDASVTATEYGARLVAVIDAAGLGRWWPHTHGEPARHDLIIEVDGRRVIVARVGLVAIDVDQSDGGFTLSVNGAPIFVRGACWVPIDPISLRNEPALLRRALEQAAAAGLNMVRVTGTMVYEDDLFYELCDELGILVWQDCMLATLDPPADDAFEAELAAEVRHLGHRLAPHACLAVVCGGSETEQQPAMLGLPVDERRLPTVETIIPEVLAEVLPDATYVTSSPTGGIRPFALDQGVAQYFGVGGYLRPVTDVKLAGVRFAAECLAFATPPERSSVDAEFGSARLAGHDPRWKRAVPRDRLTSWDFEDVRDHYVREIFGVDAFEIRYFDPDRYLDLGRAAVAQAMTDVFTYWRRPDSTCAGGLVLTLRDLVPGAGWGLVDSTGLPKAPWYALRRVLAPVGLGATDEGLNGIDLHLWNDGPHSLGGELEVALFAPGGHEVASVVGPVTLGPRSGQTMSVEDLVGRFLDINHAYRFGPSTVEVVHAVLRVDGVVVAELTHLATSQRHQPAEADVSGRFGNDADGWYVTLESARTARWVALDIAGWVPLESWFHLAPGRSRVVRLNPVQADADREPRGSVRALNSVEASISARA